MNSFAPIQSFFLTGQAFYGAGGGKRKPSIRRRRSKHDYFFARKGRWFLPVVISRWAKNTESSVPSVSLW